MRQLAIIILSIVTMVVLFFVLGTFRVRYYEEVIVSRFGRLVPLQEQPHLAYGWYLCWPTDTIVRMDKRLHLYRGDLRQLSTQDSQPISVLAFAAWWIENPPLFYERFGGSDERASVALNDAMQAEVGGVIGRHPMDSLFGQSGAELSQAPTQNSEVLAAAATREAREFTPTEKMENEVTEAVRVKMRKVGIEVKQVGFARLAFPPSVARSVYERMSAERNAQARRFRGEGSAEATRIRAEAQKIAQGFETTAEEEAQSIRGQGDKEALAILAKAQETPEARAFYQFWRELELLKNSIGKDTYLMLRSDMPLTQQLFPKDQPLGTGVGGQNK